MDAGICGMTPRSSRSIPTGLVPPSAAMAGSRPASIRRWKCARTGSASAGPDAVAGCCVRRACPGRWRQYPVYPDRHNPGQRLLGDAGYEQVEHGSPVRGCTPPGGGGTLAGH